MPGGQLLKDHVQTEGSMCHNVPHSMNNIGGLSSSATHPPTPHPLGEYLHFPQNPGKTR